MTPIHISDNPPRILSLCLWNGYWAVFLQIFDLDYILRHQKFDESNTIQLGNHTTSFPLIQLDNPPRIVSLCPQNSYLAVFSQYLTRIIFLGIKVRWIQYHMTWKLFIPLHFHSYSLSQQSTRNHLALPVEWLLGGISSIFDPDYIPNYQSSMNTIPNISIFDPDYIPRHQNSMNTIPNIEDIICTTSFPLIQLDNPPGITLHWLWDNYLGDIPSIFHLEYVPNAHALRKWL
jgi:uncharacterized protein (UPF0297 family)